MSTPSQVAVEAAALINGGDKTGDTTIEYAGIIEAVIGKAVAARKLFIDEQDSHIVSLEQQIMQLREALAGSLKHSHEDGFCTYCDKAKEALSASAPIAGKWLPIGKVVEVLQLIPVLGVDAWRKEHPSVKALLARLESTTVLERTGATTPTN